MDIHLVRNDITKMEVDAILNPTNSFLIGDSGIDGLVHRAGGQKLEDLCRSIGRVPIGEAVITDAFGLPCKKIVHAPTVRWRGGYEGEEILLRRVYASALQKAYDDPEIHTFAVPILGSGNYRCPMNIAFRIADESLKQFQEMIRSERRTKYFLVYLVLYSKASMIIVRDTLRMMIDEHIDDLYAEKHSNRFKTVDESKQSADELYQELLKNRSDELMEGKITLDDNLREQGAPFSSVLKELIDNSGRKASDIYTEAQITKSHFSKLKKSHYHIQKQTVLDLAVALHLDMDRTDDLLAAAGFLLADNIERDIIYAYFIRHGIYDLDRIKEEVYERTGEL